MKKKGAVSEKRWRRLVDSGTGEVARREGLFLGEELRRVATFVNKVASPF